MKTRKSIVWREDAATLVSADPLPREEARALVRDLRADGIAADYAPDGLDPTLAWVRFTPEGDGVWAYPIVVDGRLVSTGLADFAGFAAWLDRVGDDPVEDEGSEEDVPDSGEGEDEGEDEDEDED